MREEISECGFYPRLVAQTAMMGLGAQDVLDHLVQHEATFTNGELHRHITVLIRTKTQLLICHVDEGENGRAEAVATSEVVALRAITSVLVTRAMSDPERLLGLTEAWLAIVWGAARRIDLGPASCEDPRCEADHGYTGVLQPDDITVRMSPQADGANAGKLVSFGMRLQGVIG
ncbi:MAG: phosphodiesterase [Tessaracoccus sp.]|nr:phosphodiesterase [Tessaracoccus sp.]